MRLWSWIWEKAGFTKLGGAHILVLFVALVLGIGVIAIGQIPAHEDALEIVLYLTGGFIIGLAFFLSGFRQYRKRNLVLNTPTSTVRSIAMGNVELQGIADPKNGETVESPFSGEECLFYRYEVEEYRRRGKRSHWVTVDEGRGGVSFYLEDDTGRVLVDPRGASLRLPQDNLLKVNAGDEPPEQIQQFAERNDEIEFREDLDLKLFEIPRGNSRRFKEWYVTPGEEVYVFGTAMERPDFEGSSRNEENIVINKDRSTPLFLISDSSEKELLSSLTKSVFFRVFGGAAVSIGCFAGLLLFVGLL